jgi:hypothetical protein
MAESESIFLAAGQGRAAQQIHERAVPVLSDFCILAADPRIAAALQPRLGAWLELRKENRARVGAIRTRLADEGRRVSVSRLRLAQLASAYSKARRRSERLSAAV